MIKVAAQTQLFQDIAPMSRKAMVIKWSFYFNVPNWDQLNKEYSRRPGVKREHQLRIYFYDLSQNMFI